MSLPVFRRLAACVAPIEFARPGGYAEIWRITWPLIIMNASNTVMLLCNRCFLAMTSLEDLTAAVPAGQLFFSMMSFFLITCSFTATIVAQNHGKKDERECVRAAWNGFYFGCIVAVGLGLALPWVGERIICMSHFTEDIRVRELAYFAALCPCAGMACVETAFLSYFTGKGRTNIVGAVKIFAMCVSVPLNYVFIFGKLGVPAMGIVGAAMAASVASGASALLSFLIFFFDTRRKFPIQQHMRFQPDIVRKLLAFGIPGGVQVFLRSLCFAIVIMMIGELGKVSLSAVSLAMTINMLSFVPLVGLSDASSVITGKYIGEGHFSIARTVVWRALGMMYVYAAAIALVYVFAPNLLIELFHSDNGTTSAAEFQEAAKLVRIILLIQCVQNFFDSLRFIVLGGLRGAGDTRVPLLLGAITALLIMLPGAWISINVLRLPVYWCWALSISLYIAADAALMTWRRATGAWKKIRVILIQPLDDEEEATA